MVHCGNPTRIGQKGMDLLKQFEGLELTAYKDIADVWTIGYGHTGTDAAKQGNTVTGQEAEDLLKRDLDRFERSVYRLVNVKLRKNQFDALVVLAYNIGAAAFADSTVLKRLNRGDDYGAANAFLMWNKARVNGQLKVVRGLVRRRKAERELFLSS